MGKICTFIGNKDVLLDKSDIIRLKNIITTAITEHNVHEFYCGNYGNFDIACASILRSLKHVYDISIVFVTPYMNKRYLSNERIKFFYDEILYPALETTPCKFAIIKRNKFMIDKSDIVIAGVYKSYGNAFRFLKYAQSKNKKIFYFNL